jgi:VCBS repeat protein/FG-GAP repeat protein
MTLSRLSTLLVILALVATVAASTLVLMASRKNPLDGKVVFKKTIIDHEFRSEGVAVADVNRDGKLDILAGNLWYEAPNWVPHEIAPVQKFDAARGYSNSFLNYTSDINGDGWPDQIVFGFPGKEAFWRENPKGKPGHWKEYLISRTANSESPAFADLLANRSAVLVFPYSARSMAWYEPSNDLSQEFIHHLIGNPPDEGSIPRHGMGVGDVNGDGRADVLTDKGFWEAPKDPRSGPWKFVPANLGPDCAQMYTYDVNADGLPDVLSSSAHGIGIWWYEQRKGRDGVEFIQHLIDDSFSQSHALVMADINGDGIPDLVTGKRFWAHGPNVDVRPGDPAVLCWFELRRSGGAVKWIRHEIDSDSGVGTQFVVADMNGDGRADIVISNKKGVFLFEQRRSGKD